MKILKLEILKPVYSVSILSDGFEPGTLIRYLSGIAIEAEDGSTLNLSVASEVAIIEKLKVCGAYLDMVKALTAELKYEAKKALDKFEAERSA